MNQFKMDCVPHLSLIPTSLRKGYLIAVNNGMIIEESEARIKAILNCEEQVRDIIFFCKEYSYTLPTPNIENFKNMFDRIYLRISSGEIWEEIKEELQESLK